MKKQLKIMVSVFTLSAIMLGALVLYWSRNQRINFSDYIPHEIEHCGNMLDQRSRNYTELVKWLELNQRGWKNTVVTYLPKSVYKSPKITINVMPYGVVVNYQAKTGSWSQVVRAKKPGELPHQCSGSTKFRHP